MSTQPFTNAEYLVARVVSAKPIDTANESDIEAGGYLGPIADAVLRGDLSEKAMASLGRELLMQYTRDVLPLVVAADAELEAAVRDAEAAFRQVVRDTPNHLLSHAGVPA